MIAFYITKKKAKKKKLGFDFFFFTVFLKIKKVNNHLTFLHLVLHNKEQKPKRKQKEYFYT